MFRKNDKPNFWKILPHSQNGSIFPQFASENLYTSSQNSLYINFSEISLSNGTLQIKKMIAVNVLKKSFKLRCLYKKIYNNHNDLVLSHACLF